MSGRCSRSITLVALVIGFVLNINTAVAIEISGKLVLPAAFSPVGDMPVIVSASNQNGAGFAQQQIIIPGSTPGGSEINFSIPGVPNDNSAAWRLNYFCTTFPDPVPCENIVASGFYEDTIAGNVVYRSENASDLPGNTNHTNLSMTFLQGEPVSGSLALPSGVAPASGIEFSVFAESLTPPTVVFGIGNLIIPASSSSGAYKFSLPDNNSESWNIRYQCNASGDADCSPYLEFGYYLSSLANNTTDNSNAVEDVAGGSPLSNIDMTLLTGYLISGKIKTPTTVTQVGGMGVMVSAQDDNNLTTVSSTHIIIPKDSTDFPYTLSIPTSGSADWRVSYDCDVSATPLACNDYITKGFYDTSETNDTGTSAGSATLLTGGQGHDPIDMTVLTGSAISGTLELSQGVAPAGDIRFSVNAANTNGSGGSHIIAVTMPSGSNEVNFNLVVDPDVSKTWRLSYDCSDLVSPACAQLTDTAYYDSSTGDMVLDANLATELTGGASHPDNLLLIQSSLPDLSSFCFPVKTNTGVSVICL